MFENCCCSNSQIMILACSKEFKLKPEEIEMVKDAGTKGAN